MGRQVVIVVHACQGCQRPEASCLPVGNCHPSQRQEHASSAQSRAFHWELVGKLQKELDEVEVQGHIHQEDREEDPHKVEVRYKHCSWELDEVDQVVVTSSSDAEIQDHALSHTVQRAFRIQPFPCH